MRRALALAAGLALLPWTAAQAADWHVHIQSSTFSPRTASIHPGDGVTWHNHDNQNHRPTADDASFQTPVLTPGSTATVTFSLERTVPYHCAIHGSMTGKVIVAVPGAIPDLVITALDSWAEVPGVTTQLNATLRNVGNLAAGASVVSLRYRYHGADYAIGNATAPALDTGQAHVVRVDWSTLGLVGEFLVTARADATGLVAEGDETNNEAERPVAVLVEGFPGVDVRQPL